MQGYFVCNSTELEAPRHVTLSTREGSDACCYIHTMCYEATKATFIEFVTWKERKLDTYH